MKKFLIVGEAGTHDELLYDTDDMTDAEIQLTIEIGRGADAYIVTDATDEYIDSLTDRRV